MNLRHRHTHLRWLAGAAALIFLQPHVDRTSPTELSPAPDRASGPARPSPPSQRPTTRKRLHREPLNHDHRFGCAYRGRIFVTVSPFLLAT